jgi:hypothetical protein
MDKQGYPLEMHTGRAFGEHGCLITFSEYFSDPETDEKREIDVHAMFAEPIMNRTNAETNYLMEVDYYIECKLSKDKPWVVFRLEGNDEGSSQWARFSLLTSDLLYKLLETINWPSELFATSRPNIPELLIHRYAHGVTQAFTSAEDIAYKALYSCAKATVAKAKEDNAAFRRGVCENGMYSLSLYLPVVVVDCDLFEYTYHLDGSSTVNRIPYYAIEWEAVDYENRCPNIYIVTKNGLDIFLSECDKLHNYLIHLMWRHKNTIVTVHAELDKGNKIRNSVE